MLVAFLFFIISRQEIPSHLSNIAKKAQEVSKVKIPKIERVDKANPGDYSFKNVDFKLKKTLVTPKTNDIKGFAIEDNYLALAKRKHFNLDDDFVFVDPSNQKFYRVSTTIYEDAQINIYSIKEVPIFELMTNFKYHRKSTKEYSPKLSINWEQYSQYPILHPINESTSRASIGFRGTFSIDLTVTFKTFSDVYIKGIFGIDGTLSSIIELNKGSFENLNDLKLFDIPPIPVEEMSMNFIFKGIEFTLSCLIKSEGIISDRPFGDIEETIGLTKSYHITGSKTIEITNYITKDTKWNLDIVAYPETIAVTNNSYVPHNLEFRVTTELRLYYSIDISFGEIKSTFESGLSLPVKYYFVSDIQVLNPPGMIGEISCSSKMFYKIDNITIKGNNGQEQIIIKDQQSEASLTKTTTGTYRLRFFDKFKEGLFFDSTPSLKKNYNFIEYDNIKAVKENDPKLYQLELDVFYNGDTFTWSLPFKKFTTVPDSINSYYFVKSSSIEITTSYYSFHFDESVKEGKSSLIYASDFVKNNYDFASNKIGPTRYNFTFPDLTFDMNIWKVFKIQDYQQFKFEGNHLPYFSLNHHMDYILLKEDELIVGIDTKAEFCPEVSNYADPQFGVFHYNDGLRDGYYQLTFNDFYGNPVHAFLNFTVISYRNGKEERLFIGAGYVNGRSYGGSSDPLHGKPRFLASTDENTVLNVDALWYIDDPIEVYNVTFQFTRADFENRHLFLEFYRDGEEYFSLEFLADNEVDDLPVVFKPSTKNKKYVLVPATSTDLNMKGEIEVRTSSSSNYAALKLSSTTFQIKDCYIVLKVPSDVFIIAEDGKKLWNDIYYFYCRNEELYVPFRRLQNTYNFKFEYLVCDFIDINDLEIGNEEKKYTFNKYRPSSVGFLVKTYNGKYHIFNDANASIFDDSMDIDNNTKIVGFTNTGYTDYQEAVTFIHSHAYIEEGQLSIKYDLTRIENCAKRNGKNEYEFYVACNREEVTSLYIPSKGIEAQIVNKEAKFTIPINYEDDEESKEDKEVEIFCVCQDNSSSNCVIRYEADEGDYQLIRFPNKEGINTTGRGQYSSFIKASKGKSYSYYKLFDGPFEHIRSYSSKSTFKLIIEDVFPYDNIPKSSMIINEKEKKNETEEEPTPAVTPSASRKPHNLKDAYRMFCLKDSLKNSVPFSNNYMNNKYEEFKKSLGIKSTSDETQIRIDDEDECIYIDIKLIERNINNITNEIIDIELKPNSLEIDDSLSDFIPGEYVEDIEKEDVSKNKKLIFFVIIGVVVVIIIIVIIVVVVCVKKKRRYRRNSSSFDTLGQISDEE